MKIINFFYSFLLFLSLTFSSLGLADMPPEGDDGPQNGTSESLVNLPKCKKSLGLIPKEFRGSFYSYKGEFLISLAEKGIIDFAGRNSKRKVSKNMIDSVDFYFDGKTYKEYVQKEAKTCLRIKRDGKGLMLTLGEASKGNIIRNELGAKILIYKSKRTEGVYLLRARGTNLKSFLGIFPASEGWAGNFYDFYDVERK